MRVRVHSLTSCVVCLIKGFEEIALLLLAHANAFVGDTHHNLVV
jgi:hypothetical protein